MEEEEESVKENYPPSWRNWESAEFGRKIFPKGRCSETHGSIGEVEKNIILHNVRLMYSIYSFQLLHCIKLRFEYV